MSGTGPASGFWEFRSSGDRLPNSETPGSGSNNTDPGLLSLRGVSESRRTGALQNSKTPGSGSNNPKGELP